MPGTDLIHSPRQDLLYRLPSLPQPRVIVNGAALTFGWYVGRRLRRNVIRDISAAQRTMIPTAQVAVATEIVQRMALVEIAKEKGGDAGVLRATQPSSDKQRRIAARSHRTVMLGLPLHWSKLGLVRN